MASIVFCWSLMVPSVRMSSTRYSPGRALLMLIVCWIVGAKLVGPWSLLDTSTLA
jgi:hypothetical protein